jgi:malonate-semialdehyde dehydrogenase (acetylating)/methylmalonate-semialdehyde dehydrogenase
MEPGDVIGGKPLAGTSGRDADLFNRATGTAEKTEALARRVEVQAPPENALAAQPARAAMSAQRRAFRCPPLLYPNQDLMQARRREGAPQFRKPTM